jgi:hypothetical protein
VSKAIDRAAGAEREVVGRKGGRAAYGFTPKTISHEPGRMFRWGDVSLSWDDLPEQGRAYYTRAAAQKGDLTAPAPGKAGAQR